MRSSMTSRQRGSTILEALLAGVLIMTILAFGASALMDGVDEMKDQTAAEHFQMVQQAVDDWMQAEAPGSSPTMTNYENLLDIMSGDPAGTTRVEGDDIRPPMPLTMNALRAGTFLPSGFQDTNAFGDTYRLVVRKIGPTVLEVAVLTEGTDRLNDFETRTPTIASKIGPQAGAIADDGTGNMVIRGAFGGWESQISAWGFGPGAIGEGRLASVQGYDSGEVIGDYLYRRPQPGHPEATTMFTNLDMGGNDLINADRMEIETLRVRDGGEITAGTIVAREVETEVVRAQSLGFSNASGAFSPMFFATRYIPDPANPTDPNAAVDEYDLQLEEHDFEAIDDLNNAPNCPGGAPLIYNNGQWQCGGSELTRGMITPFNTSSCPSGWTRYEMAQGRYVFGANSSSRAGETGGREQLYLSRSNMPPATMTLGASRWDFYRQTQTNSLPVGTGGNQPIDLKPPYLALTYCRKN